MTVNELLEKYYFHDSCITSINYNSESKQLNITMDFCNWAQSWYKDEDPENICLKLTLFGIDSYDNLLGEIDYYSVLDAKEKDNALYLFLLDDINNKTYELLLSPNNIRVDTINTQDDK